MNIYIILYSHRTTNCKAKHVEFVVCLDLWRLGTQVNWPKWQVLILKQKHSNIVFLQESHMMPCDISKKRWQGQVLSASHSSHARGVLILIHRSIPFQVVISIIDSKGRWISLQGILLYKKLNLVNGYGPNEDNPPFFDNLYLTLSMLPCNFIIEGDFNVALDPVKDRPTGLDSSHTRARKSILNFRKDFNFQLNLPGIEPKQLRIFLSLQHTQNLFDHFLIST